MSNDNLKCVTDEVVQKALCSDKGPDARLSSWTLEGLANKYDGFTSDIKNMRIKYYLGEELHEVCHVLKANPGRGEAAEYFMGLIFAKECNFYSDVIPTLNGVLKEIGLAPLSFPKCFYSSLEKTKEIIILENLKVQDYQMKDKALGVDAAHASLVMKEVAKLHAASVLLQAKMPEKDLVDMFECLQKEWTEEFNLGCDFQGFVEGFLDTGIAMFEKFGECEKVISWIKKIKPDAWKIYREQIVKTSPFAVIVHGDCWINNMFFRYDSSNNPVDVKLFDMQGCRKASLAIDLQHFFNLNMPGTERRGKLQSLLATYHTAFDEVMKAGGSTVPFTLEELRQEYLDRGFYGTLYAIMWLPNMVRRPKDFQDILDDETKDAQKNNVLMMVDDNPLLKPTIMSVIDEWTDYGLIS